VYEMRNSVDRKSMKLYWSEIRQKVGGRKSGNYLYVSRSKEGLNSVIIIFEVALQFFLSKAASAPDVDPRAGNTCFAALSALKKGKN
jgi:hypothetical protein